MATTETRPHHRFVFQKASTGSPDIESTWRMPVPRVEARALFQMLTRGHTDIASLRDLIDIPEETEQKLRAFVAEYPDNETRIERLLNFRKRVRAEFERLIQTTG